MVSQDDQKKSRNNEDAQNKMQDIFDLNMNNPT